MTRPPHVRSVNASDETTWLRLRCELWPDADDEHRRNVRRFFEGTLREPLEVLLAEDGEGVIGFVELSIRAYAEGCDTDQVAYVEGWYVSPTARGRGVGRALIDAAEAWAQSRGCTELASDSELDDSASALAHRACGFEETGRIRCYRKRVGGTS